MDNQPEIDQINQQRVVAIQDQFRVEQIQNERRRKILIFLLATFLYSIVRFDDSFYDGKTHVKFKWKNNEGKKLKSWDYVNHQLYFVNKSATLNHSQQNQYSYQLLQSLSGKKFLGQWISNNESEPTSQGQMELAFYRNEHLKPQRFQLVVSLIKGIYFDDYQTTLVYDLFQTNLSYFNYTRTIVLPSVNTSIQGGDIYKADIQTICKMNLRIQFNEVNDIYDSFVQQVQLSLQSQNTSECGYSLSYHGDATQNLTDVQSKAMFYSIFITVVAVIQVIASLKILKDIILDERQASKYSIMTLIMVTGQDGYLSILHFYFSLNNETLFQYFITPSFLYFILFSVLEMRLIIFVWKERYSNVQDNITLRRELLKFYFKFYISMIMMVIFFYQFIYQAWFTVLLNLYLLPQIIHTAIRGQAIQFDKFYIYGLMASRSLIPLYYRGCPDNFLELKPNLILCITIVLVIVFQVLVVYYQSQLGPRFFIPLRFQPKKYNYFQDYEGDVESCEECAVCILPLSQSPAVVLTAEEEANFVLKRIIEKENNGKQIMKTPCEHKFHIICLAKWMSIRMNCPSCRADLPIFM